MDESKRIPALLAAALAALALSFVGLRPVLAPHVAPSARATSPYPRNDPWKDYLAPESVCPGGDDASASQVAQETTAICLLNYARRRANLPPLQTNGVLNVSSAYKARDIVRCGAFTHEACGKPADAVAHEAGYGGGGFGENIYEGPGPYAPPRLAVDGWLNSEHHRENLFDPNWTEQGIALLSVPSFGGQRDVAIWVSEFGRS